jgi:MFS family permease
MIIEIFVLIAISLSEKLEGLSGYWIIFILYIFSMVGGNITHAATQGLIPDLVEDEKKGMFSGIKTLFELVLPILFVSFFIAKWVSDGKINLAVTAIILTMLTTLTITMFVPEKQREKPPSAFSWPPIIRIAAMTATFTLIILLVGATTKGIIHIASKSQDDLAYLLVGVAGLIGIIVTILVGVWASVRISIGDEIKQNKSFTWWVVSRLAFLVGVTNMSGFLLYFLQEKFSRFPLEKAADPASKLLMFVGISLLITAIIGGWLADRISKKFLIMLGGVITAIGAGILIVGSTLPVTYLGGAIIGLGAGLFYSTSWALGTEIVPKEKAGQFLGLSNLAGAGAGAIGAYIGGPIADHLSYHLVISIYSIMIFISLFALIGVKEKR